MVDILISDLLPLRQNAAFAQEVSWRWIFWILLPFNAIALVVVLLYLRLRRTEIIATEKLREVDYLGSLLSVASSTSFLIGISWGGSQFPWDSFQTLGPLIIGLAGLAAFCVWEGYFATHPLVPLGIFASRTAAQGYLGITMTGMIMWAALYYLPLYYEGVLGYLFIIGSVALLPVTVTVSPAAVVTGILITKTGRYRIFLWVGWTISLLGMGLFIDLKESTTVAQWVFLTIWAGLGIGMLLSAMQIAVQPAAPDQDVALAAAMVPELRTFGQALGLTIFGAVFSNTVKNELVKSIFYAGHTAVLGNDAITSVQTVRGTVDGPQKQTLVRAIWLGTRAVDCMHSIFCSFCCCKYRGQGIEFRSCSKFSA